MGRILVDPSTGKRFRVVEKSSNRYLSRTKILVLLILAISLTASSIWYTTRATPSPSIGGGNEPGAQGPCTWFISLDGTTPVARAMVGGLSVNIGFNVVGTAGQDIGSFVTSIVSAGQEICYSGQNFIPTGSTTITANNVTISGTGATTFTPSSGTFDIFVENGFDFRIHDINFEMANGGGWAVNIGSTSSSNRCWAYNLNIHNPQTGGIKLGFNSGLCFVHNNRVQSIQSPSSAGILVQGVDSHVYDNDAGGFVNAGGGLSCSRCANVDFQGNMVYSNFIGIDLYLPERIRIVGNMVEFNHYEGIRVTVDSTAGAWQGITISDNVLKANANFAPHTVGAIHLTSSGTAKVANIAVMGNVAYDGQVPKTQNVGLLIDSANVVNVTAVGNIFTNNSNLVAISVTAGTNILLRSNQGYNPVGNIASPFDNTNFTVGACLGGANLPTSTANDYTIVCTDSTLLVSNFNGGTLTLKDATGNTILSGFSSTSTPIFVTIGEKLRFVTADPSAMVVAGN